MSIRNSDWFISRGVCYLSAYEKLSNRCRKDSSVSYVCPRSDGEKDSDATVMASSALTPSFLPKSIGIDDNALFHSMREDFPWLQVLHED